MYTNRLAIWFSLLMLTVSTNSIRSDEPAKPTSRVTVSTEAVKLLNAKPVHRPQDAEAPSILSADHPAHAVAYNFQAPGIAIMSLPDGRTRVWLSWYQQNNNPGGGAIGKESIPHCVYAYSDEPFGTAQPIWHSAFYVEPVIALGGETASDPEVALLPDGRMLCSYITSGPSRTRKRSTYAFIVENPTATNGEFAVGKQQWLEYGVLSQPFIVNDSQVYAVIDEWNVARRFCKLEFDSMATRDAVAVERISDIPWPGHPALTIFFESSMHVVSGGRFRAYRRTKDGVYTTLSEVGGRAWGIEEKWTDHGSTNSRSAFARSPFTGRVLGAVNCPKDDNRQYRTDLTLVLSKEEGAPGSFSQSLNIEPDVGVRNVASQYPRLAFDKSGFVYCVYRWSDKRTEAPHNGAAIIVARVREDLLAAGTATLANVEKRVAVTVTPFDKKMKSTKDK